MPKGSGLTKRDVVNHGQNGKGDASRITDVQAYRQNFDAIDWSNKKKGMTLQDIHDEYEWRMGL